MRRKLKLKIAALAAVVLGIAGGGVAFASTQLSPQRQSDAILADAAEQLGVSASELEEALTKALQNRVDAAVDDGRLTEEQGEALKERLAEGDVPLIGLGPGGPAGLGHHHVIVDLAGAAAYLDLTEAELRTALLDDGQTLAEIAEAEGKSVDGLVAALVSAARERLDGAVEDGRLTEEQRTDLLAELEEAIRTGVEEDLPLRPALRGDGPAFGLAPPPAPSA